MKPAGREDELKGLRLAVVLYAVVLVLKLGAYFVTGVMAVLAEALHTFSDLLISGFLLLAVVWSRKAADREHMFGHGRAQNVAALVAATLFLSFTSYKLYEEAIPRLIRPEQMEHTNLTVAFVVLIVSMVIAAAPLINLLRLRTRGAAAKAQLIELFNDELGLLAALVGTFFIARGYPLADPLAAIVVATVIAVNAVGLFRENLGLLLGRSPSPEFLDRVGMLAASVPGVRGVHSLRAEYVGPEQIHVDMHLEVRPGMTIREANRIAGEARDRVHQSIGGLYCAIHVDPERRQLHPWE